LADTDGNQVAPIIDVKYIERNRQNGWPDLDERRKALAYNYVSNGYDHRSAASNCGFSANSGLRLIREPLLGAFIEHLQKETYQADIISRSLVESRLDQLWEIAVGDCPIPIVLANGEEIEAAKFHGELAMSVIKEQNKMKGFVKEDTNKSGNVLIQINTNAMTGEVEAELVDRDE
jgi:hypothetical protein